MDDHKSDVYVIGQKIGDLCHQEAYDMGKEIASTKEISPQAVEAFAASYSSLANVTTMAAAVVTKNRTLSPK